MKITVGHALSLGLNGLLLVLVVSLWRTSAPVAPTSPGSRVPRAHPPGDGYASADSAPPEPVPVRIGAGWEQWIETLRRAGVPADVLAGLVRADFDKRWQTRAAETQRQYLQGHADADALAVLALEHDARLDAELRSALGADAFRRWDMARVMAALNVGQMQLSDAERDTVYELERGLQDDLRKAQADKLRGGIDQATLNILEQNAQEAVARKLRALLGEPRAAQLQGVDDTIGNLQRGLPTGSLSDAQLQALTEVQRDWDRTRSQLAALQNNTGHPAYAGAIQRAEEKWRGEFQAIAGADALEQFLKSQDSRYVDLRRFAAGWQVSPLEIEGIFETVGIYDEVVHQYGLDAQAREADPGATRAALGQFQQQTERSLQQRLGADRYAVLKQNGIIP
ncbi:MAG TPA: hypothetical protein VMC06_07085 [Opitutaceae bacterium]|nr:hypothetical protein [Opitutaceae bacterium]